MKTSKQANEVFRLRKQIETQSEASKRLQERFSLHAGKESTCGTKTKYTQSDAIEQAVLRKMSPYRCPFCKGWHIGHPISEEDMKDILNS